MEMEMWARWDRRDKTANFYSPIHEYAATDLTDLFGRLYHSLSGEAIPRFKDFADSCYVTTPDEELWDKRLDDFAAKGSPSMLVMIGDPGVGKTEYFSHFALTKRSLQSGNSTVAVLVEYDTGGSNWRDKINKHIDQFICSNADILSQMVPSVAGRIQVFCSCFTMLGAGGVPDAALINVNRPAIMRGVIEGLRSQGRHFLLLIDNVDQADEEHQRNIIVLREELHREYPCPIAICIRPETSECLQRNYPKHFCPLPAFHDKQAATLADIMHQRISYLADNGEMDDLFSHIQIRISPTIVWPVKDFTAVLRHLLLVMQDKFRAVPDSPPMSFLDLVTRLSNETSRTAALSHIVTTLKSGHLPMELIRRAISGLEPTKVPVRNLIMPLVLGTNERYTELERPEGQGPSGGSIINLYDCNLSGFNGGALGVWLRPLCLMPAYLGYVREQPVPRAEVAQGILLGWPDKIQQTHIDATITVLLSHGLLEESSDGLEITPAGRVYIDSLAVSRSYCQSVHRRTMRDDPFRSSPRSRSELSSQLFAFEQFLERTFNEVAASFSRGPAKRCIPEIQERLVKPVKAEMRDYALRLLSKPLEDKPSWTVESMPQCLLHGKVVSVTPGRASLDYPEPQVVVDHQRAAIASATGTAPVPWKQMKFVFDGRTLYATCEPPFPCNVGCSGRVALVAIAAAETADDSEEVFDNQLDPDEP